MNYDVAINKNTLVPVVWKSTEYYRIKNQNKIYFMFVDPVFTRRGILKEHKYRMIDEKGRKW